MIDGHTGQTHYARISTLSHAASFLTARRGGSEEQRVLLTDFLFGCPLESWRCAVECFVARWKFIKKAMMADKVSRKTGTLAMSRQRLPEANRRRFCRSLEE